MPTVLYSQESMVNGFLGHSFEFAAYHYIKPRKNLALFLKVFPLYSPSMKAPTNEPIFSRWRDCVPPGRLYNVHEFRRQNFPHCHKSKPHAHDFAEVFWISQGSCIHYINGTERVMHARELYLIRPQRDTHALRIERAPFTLFNVAFPAAILNDLCQRYPVMHKLWRQTQAQPTLLHLTETELQCLDSAAIELLRTAQDRMLLDCFLLGMINSFRRSHTDPWRACPPWLQEAVRAMRQPENMSEGIPAFLKYCRRSPAHVARMLKKHTGMTPSDVVNQARLEYAAARLQDPGSKIQNIALDCGFNSLSYFYRVFHRRYGLTPRHYRQQHSSLPMQMGLV
jgi:AraC family cel operon transcriptional repressor